MAKNNVNAAITGSDISEYSKIVISSSRALTNGETVRVALIMKIKEEIIQKYNVFLNGKLSSYQSTNLHSTKMVLQQWFLF